MPNPGAPSLQDIFSGNSTVAPTQTALSSSSTNGKPSLNQIFTPGVFQPAQTGNTPQNPTSPFNPNSPNSKFEKPTQAGATQINYQNDPGTSTGSKFMGSLAKGALDTGKGIVQKTGEAYMDMTKNLGQDFQNLNKDTQEVTTANGGNLFSFQNPVAQTKAISKMAADSILNPAAHVIEGVFSPLAAIFKQGEEPLAQGLQNAPGFSQIANGKVGDAVSNTIDTLNQKVNQLKQTNPNKVKALGSAVNLIMSVIGEGATNETGSTVNNGIKTGADNLVNTTSNIASDISQKTSSMVQDFKDVQSGKATVKANTLAGQITQGGIEDVPATKNALSSIDMTNVENAPKGQKYQALQDTLNQSVKDQKSAQQTALDSNKNTYKLSDLSTGNGKTSHNFVQDALDQLKTFYQKTNNVAGEAKITALEDKANSTGLTLKELDQLAVEHGSNIKAFNANGEAASGLTKQAAENTRTGVKNTVAEKFDNPAYKAADAQMADTIRTRDLVSQISEKANALQQKIIKRGWFGKIGYGIGKGLDLATGGGLKNFVNYFIPRGEGLKTLNAVDLENSLQKNLQKLQDLTDSTSQADLTKKLNQAIKENNSKPEKGKTTNSIVKASDLGSKPLPKNIKVNNFQKDFPNYKTADQIKSATKILKAKDQAGKSFDIKVKKK